MDALPRSRVRETPDPGIVGPVPEGDCEGPQLPSTICSVGPGHSYYIHARINDRRISFLVETRSEFTIIQRDTWEKVSPENKELEYCGKSFVSVDGTHLAVHMSCVVPVCIEGRCSIIVYMS